jgi:hypothetical protein
MDEATRDRTSSPSSPPKSRKARGCLTVRRRSSCGHIAEARRPGLDVHDPLRHGQTGRRPPRGRRRAGAARTAETVLFRRRPRRPHRGGQRAAPPRLRGVQASGPKEAHCRPRAPRRNDPVLGRDHAGDERPEMVTLLAEQHPETRAIYLSGYPPTRPAEGVPETQSRSCRSRSRLATCCGGARRARQRPARPGARPSALGR